MKPPIQVTNELFFKLWNNRILVHENLFALYHPALCLKGSFNLFYVFCCNKSGGLRERFALPSAKFLKSIFSFGARHACVILRRQILVTSYVVATRFFSHIVSVSAISQK